MMKYRMMSFYLTAYGKYLMLASIVLLLVFGTSVPAYASESDLSLESDTETPVSDTEITASDTQSDKIYTVTKIDSSEQLANLEPFKIARRASSQDTEVLYNYISDNNLLTVTATITDSSGKTFDKSLNVIWDCTTNSPSGVNVSVCGEYTETGTIQLPDDSYHWGEGVINTLNFTVIVYEPELIEIVEIIPLESDFDKAFSLAQGADIDAFLDEAPLQQACDCKDAAENVYSCPIVYHTDAVRTDALGIYYITAAFEAPDNCYFSEELNIPTYSIPISVQAPEYPRLDVSYIGAFNYIHFPWVASDGKCSTMEVWVSENEGEWRIMELDDEVYIHTSLLQIVPYMMAEGNSYRIQVKYEGGQTGIASFTYGENALTDKGYLEGDRDGGDTDGNPPEDSEDDENTDHTPPSDSADNKSSSNPETAETTPTPDAVIPENTVSEDVISETAISEAVVSKEVVSESNSIENKEIAEAPTAAKDDTSAERTKPYLLGSEISLMLENLGSARFSAEAIMLDIPADTITALGISDTDQLLVTVLPLENNRFSIEILKNDVAVTTVPSMQISLPYEPAENATPVLVNEAGREVATGDHKPDTGLVTFTISETGTFHIKEVKAASQDSYAVKTLTAPEISGSDHTNGNFVFRLIAVILAVVFTGSATVAVLIFIKKRRR
ncbi:MAG: hypothetical protein IJD96_00470 [Lachnospiraceae bacterium]|nr:hypothetical protein [Lachnospiraceae bacterium]